MRIFLLVFAFTASLLIYLKYRKSMKVREAQIKAYLANCEKEFYRAAREEEATRLMLKENDRLINEAVQRFQHIYTGSAVHTKWNILIDGEPIFINQ